MKVWVTKYLFTSGIEEVEVRGAGRKMVIQIKGGSRCFHGSAWHLGLRAAQEHALVMIAKKRSAIAAQLKKLDSLEQTLRNTMRGR